MINLYSFYFPLARVENILLILIFWVTLAQDMLESQILILIWWPFIVVNGL
jgi:hypothetical protein